MTQSQADRASFVEEAREHAETMDHELVAMQEGAASAEAVDAVFRAAHSIKGSANLFGCKELAQVTHELETWLNGIREGRLSLTQAAVRVLLDVVDHLNLALDAFEGEDSYAPEEALSLIATLPRDENSGAAAEEVKAASAPSRRYRISLRFSPDALTCGVEPLTLLRSLAQFGPCTTRAQSGRLPPLAEVDSLVTYLDFDLELCSTAPIEDIRDAIDWPEALEKHQVEEVARPAAVTRRGSRKQSDRSIKVDSQKVDELMSLLGELVITEGQLANFTQRLPESLADEFVELTEALERDIRGLQDAVLRVRMVPMRSLTTRLPRLVADVSHSVGKSVRLEITGERTEVDKKVLEALADPLQHLLRNCIGHGIEAPEVRAARGKAEEGLVSVRTMQRDGFIEAVIEDDGGGVNREAVLKKARSLDIVGEDEELSDQRILDLLFAPGLSTASEVTDLSGRGVGMDVVRQNIEALGGNVHVTSEMGKGTSFTIRLPLTTAIVDGQLVRCAGSVYVVPLMAVRELLRLQTANVRTLPSGVGLLRSHGQDIPIVDLAEVMCGAPLDEPQVLVTVESDRGVFALAVDEAFEQRQVVVKSLADNYGSAPGVSAATVLGNGSVAMIVDLAALADGIGARGTSAAA